MFNQGAAHPINAGTITSIQLMFIYQQTINSADRIVWYGGQSTQIHYEVKDASGNWREMNVRSFMNDMPAGMSEMHALMVDYLDYCLTMKYDNLIATI